MNVLDDAAWVARAIEAAERVHAEHDCATDCVVDGGVGGE